MNIEQIQESIAVAFAELPVPHPSTLIHHLHSRHPEGEERTRSAFAGKTWQSLTPQFLSEQWAGYCYLSPEAYRYYLPALLSAVLKEYSDARQLECSRGSTNRPSFWCPILNEFTDSSDLAHSVVFSLLPSFYSLYYQGDDHDFRAKEAAFTQTQYGAVTAFLGFAFDQMPRLRHMAAQALHWGWNRCDTPALKAAEAYYHDLFTFNYPEPEDPELANLCRKIRSAFAATPYPGDDKLSGSEQGDEPAECAMEFRGLKWQSAHPELLKNNYTALSFLTDAGFRYFLPAFLFADLLGGDDYDSNADPEGYLTCEDIPRFAGFSRDERMAIIHFLEFKAKDEFVASEIGRSLDRYWRPSVQERRNE